MKYFSLILLILILVGCNLNSNTSQYFYLKGKAEEFHNENEILVNCTSQLNNSLLDYGVSCLVILDEDTVIVDEAGETYSKEALKNLLTEEDVHVKVYISEELELKKNNPKQVATKILIMN
ncbi:hypothetical protein CIB95_07785 [Lottiidibacillus patelloidae]|uniref:Uncharacterized protein n=1 Tax=Lottiidibacillus patelloidae TaxID=2670334 RepID=A0A263BUD1_9BACI|nr:hypothetical protein [Lottiidibacillus patelloidae]OZM57353.1 hypothetical protein CIB95_07785 [Lottiidibacillus patelloidae]